MTRRSLILAVALVLGGCGGDDGRLSKGEYEDRLRSEYGELQRAFRATDVPLRRLARRVRDAQKQLRESADDLDGIQPPPDVETENAQLVDGMRRYADDLDRLRRAAARGDRRAVADFNAGVTRNDAVEQMAAAAAGMRGKGYDLRRFAEE